MSVFNFIETFFFISLGITFVLISLLVYHFRQRIIVLEQKNDTMFEIINNVVNEISNIRNNINISHVNSLPMDQYNQYSMQNQISNMSNPYSQHVCDNNSFDDSDIDEEEEEEKEDEEDDEEEDDEDEEEDEDEDEEDEDKEDDEEYEDNEDDDEDDEDDDDNSNTKIIVSDDEIIDTGKSIKIVNVNIDSNTSEIEEIEDLEIDETMNTDEETHIEEPLLDIEPIIVHKIEGQQLNYINEENITIQSKDIYKNMTIPNLKALVISKGISTNISKLKKNELIELLENSE